MMARQLLRGISALETFLHSRGALHAEILDENMRSEKHQAVHAVVAPASIRTPEASLLWPTRIGFSMGLCKKIGKCGPRFVVPNR